MARKNTPNSDESYEQELYKTLNYSNEQFDKNVLFIASGSLGVSFAFIEKIVPDLAKANEKVYLISSWYFFAGVIFVCLISHFISSLSLRWSVVNHGNNDKFAKGSKRWNFIIRTLNIIMILGLLTGTVLLINFINKNI